MINAFMQDECSLTSDMWQERTTTPPVPREKTLETSSQEIMKSLLPQLLWPNLIKLLFPKLWQLPKMLQLKILKLPQLKILKLVKAQTFPGRNLMFCTAWLRTLSRSGDKRQGNQEPPHPNTRGKGGCRKAFLHLSLMRHPPPETPRQNWPPSMDPNMIKTPMMS